MLRRKDRKAPVLGSGKQAAVDEDNQIMTDKDAMAKLEDQVDSLTKE